MLLMVEPHGSASARTALTTTAPVKSEALANLSTRAPLLLEVAVVVVLVMDDGDVDVVTGVDTGNLSGSLYEHRPLLTTLSTLPSRTASSSCSTIESRLTLCDWRTAAQIRSTDGRCLCDFTLRMASRSHLAYVGLTPASTAATAVVPGGEAEEPTSIPPPPPTPTPPPSPPLSLMLSPARQ